MPALQYGRTVTGCPVKDVTKNFALPTVNEVAPGAMVTAPCFAIGGLAAGQVVRLTTLRGDYSVNDAAFVTGATPTSVRNGDRVVVRMAAQQTPDSERTDNIEMLIGDVQHIRQWSIRTRTSTRAPLVWQVGPTRANTQLAAIADQLQPGDVVNMDPGVYAPVRLTRAGAEAAPIVIRGVGPTRPVIRGTSADGATFRFENVHHYLLQNVEIDGGGGTRATSNNQVCVRLMGNMLVLRDVYVHGCPRHGILGSDLYSGTVVLDRVEVADAGSPATNGPGSENGKHPIYVATDRDRYPGSVLRVQNSYIHDFEGGGIKSRSERNEIYFNWVETKPQRDRVPPEIDGPVVLYTLELYGYEEYEPSPRIDSDVVGNVLVHRNGQGLRIGGDGSGASSGRVRLANNTIVLPSGFTQPVIRMFHSLDAVYMANNLIAQVGPQGSQGAVRMFRDDISAEAAAGQVGHFWAHGVPQAAGSNNWFAAGSDLRLFSTTATQDSPVAAFTGSRQGASNPGLVNLASFETLDVSVAAGSELLAAGAPLTDAAPQAFQVTPGLAALALRAPSIRPATGAPLTAVVRPAGAVPIGAQ